MVVGTVALDGRQPDACCSRAPTSAGFVFYTNYESRKGQELAARTRRCACCSRGTRSADRSGVKGVAARVDPRGVATAYFATRPRGAQLGAWASPQSGGCPPAAARSSVRSTCST